MLSWLFVLALPCFAAEPVDLVLLLATDISSSIEDDEYELQKRGIVDALNDPAVERAVRECAGGGVALAYAEWASRDQFQIVVPFRNVAEPGAITDFASELAASSRALLFRQGTDVASALARGRDAIEAAPFTSARRVIDLSGDGPQNEPSAGGGDYVATLERRRDELVAENILINGLAIDDVLKYDLPKGVTTLREYFQSHLIGGPGAFVVSIRSFAEMHARLRDKLVREICWNANT